MQELHRAQPRHDYEMKRFDSVIEHPLENDCNHTSILELKQRDAKSGDIDDSSDSSFHLSSDDSTCKAKGKRHWFFSTPSISVANLEARYDP